MVVVSYLTAAPQYDKIRNLTFGTTTDEHRAESRASWNKWDVAASGMVLQVILAGYGYFSTVQGGETYIGFVLYPIFWIGALIAAALVSTSPARRSSAGPLVAGTLTSAIGFALAFIATRYALRGLIAVVAMPLLHVSLADSYGSVMVFGFIASLFACPVGAIVGFVRGYESIAGRRPVPGRAKLA
jgi:hypothetical protein